MYRLVLYYLIGLVVVAAIFGYFGSVPYNPIAILASAAAITIVCLVTNYVFAHVFEAPANVESAYITALILALIIAPPLSAYDMRYLILAGWASVWAMASKYIFAIRKKHLFNPAALALVFTALFINQSANWWISTPVLMPFVLIGGFLMVRKLKKSDLVISFLVAAFASIEWFSFLKGSDLLMSAQRILLTSPLLFFAFVMLTEPLTTPPTRMRRIAYGITVGLIFAPAIHLWSLYSTPELALVAGNIFSYLISPKEKLMLKFKACQKVAMDTYDFIFESDQSLKFKPGQYLEWTLAHKKSDSRGNRRYFTIASSPTEPEIRIGVKFYANASSFKKTLASMILGDKIVASQLAGEFTLPKDPSQKLVFIAGGIGITPFRSIIKYLLDKNEKRYITLLYSNKTESEIAYKDVFDEAEGRLGIKTVYTLTDSESIPDTWNGERGFLDGRMIAKYVPDFKGNMFYISGPRSMVVSFENTLKKLGIPRSHVKIDFFPGFV